MTTKLLLALVVLWEFCSPVLSAASQSALQLPCFTSFLAEPVSHLQDEPTPEQIQAWRDERRYLRRQITPNKNISVEAYNAGYTTLNGLQLSNVSTEVSIIRFQIEELTGLIWNATHPNSTQPEDTSTQRVASTTTLASTASTTQASTAATTDKKQAKADKKQAKADNTKTDDTTTKKEKKAATAFNQDLPTQHAAQLTPDEIQILHGQQKAVYGWRFVATRVKRILKLRYPVPVPDTP